MAIFKRRRQSISEPRGADHIGGATYIRARGAISEECQSKRSHRKSYQSISEQEEPSEEQMKQTEPYMPQITLSGAVRAIKTHICLH